MSYSKLLETETAIAFVKERFASHLSEKLGLLKVSSPIAVMDGTGINDDLNGVERPVSFPVKALGEQRALVVHSLAKWKRVRLMQLGGEEGLGIITDMRALRPDEEYTHLHSVYVDQWDWEKVIADGQRNLTSLRECACGVYEALRETEQEANVAGFGSGESLPEELTFIHSQELLELFPGMTPKQREHEAAKRYGAVFIMGIGRELSDGEPHDGRAADYDDWSSLNEDGYFGLNGDLIVWHPVLECALELSSMGVRVDSCALRRQLAIKGCEEKAQLEFHRLLLEERLPQCIGGGIGQSRICMFVLKKSHIGEVQVGLWSEEKRREMEESGVELL
jgi:aspartate--ammonia ligase